MCRTNVTSSTSHNTCDDFDDNDFVGMCLCVCICDLCNHSRCVVVVLFVFFTFFIFSLVISYGRHSVFFLHFFIFSLVISYGRHSVFGLS